jgi:hypothetical protein
MIPAPARRSASIGKRQLAIADLFASRAVWRLAIGIAN